MRDGVRKKVLVENMYRMNLRMNKTKHRDTETCAINSIEDKRHCLDYDITKFG